MFYVLKVYWLLCNDSCAESSSPFEHAKNRFLKRILDTNLCQVLIDVKYARYWQLVLKKSLQDSVVKPIVFTAQNMKFLWKIYLINVSKSAVLCGHVYIYEINS